MTSPKNVAQATRSAHMLRDVISANADTTAFPSDVDANDEKTAVQSGNGVARHKLLASSRPGFGCVLFQHRYYEGTRLFTGMTYTEDDLRFNWVYNLDDAVSSVLIEPDCVLFLWENANHEGAMLVMENVLRDAGVATADIDYINVHGTSTPPGDASEIKAVQAVFKEDVYPLNISSTKSMTGHLLGASGAIEAVATLLAMKHRCVPPTINHFTDDEVFDKKLNFTFNQPQERDIVIALSNTFGFGGHNTSIIFKKWDA